MTSLIKARKDIEEIEKLFVLVLLGRVENINIKLYNELEIKIKEFKKSLRKMILENEVNK